MNLSTLKDGLVALRNRLEKMFQSGEHGVSTVVGEMVGELHTLVNDLHAEVEKLEARIKELEKGAVGKDFAVGSSAGVMTQQSQAQGDAGTVSGSAQASVGTLVGDAKADPAAANAAGVAGGAPEGAPK